jgi:hypothetical protein
MALQIRMFGPMNDQKKHLHNIFTDLGYPVYIDFVNRENAQWRQENKDSFFYYCDAKTVWNCDDDDLPDLQITSSDSMESGDVLMEWLEDLLDGKLKVYPYCDPPKTQLVELPKYEIQLGAKEYELETKLINDCMFYQVTKPHVDRPYVTVVRDFSVKGHKRFFTNLFVCSSWGVASKDIQFLKEAWEWLEMKGDMDLDALMKEATEACKYPALETEPEVWRTSLDNVLDIFNKRSGF